MMKVYEGNILTCDKNDSVVRYLAEQDGRIVYVGDILPAAYSNWERVELGSRALVPAFADTHIHFASFATFHAGLNVMNARSNAEILDMLKDYVAHSNDKLVIGFGASPYSVSDGKLVTRAELDCACSKDALKESAVAIRISVSRLLSSGSSKDICWHSRQTCWAYWSTSLPLSVSRTA